MQRFVKRLTSNRVSHESFFADNTRRPCRGFPKLSMVSSNYSVEQAERWHDEFLDAIYELPEQLYRHAWTRENDAYHFEVGALHFGVSPRQHTNRCTPLNRRQLLCFLLTVLLNKMHHLLKFFLR
jgi:hypothetical protein